MRTFPLVPLAALALLVPTAPPAVAGTHAIVPAHDLRTDEWTIRTADCAGTPVADSDAVALVRTRHRLQGRGALRVRTDGLAGALRERASYLGLTVHVRATTGTHPRAQWYVTWPGAVLTSAPVALEPDAWEAIEIEDAWFSDGAGWTGTMSDWVEEHGHHRWEAGLLTGGCLDSGTVLVDRVDSSPWRSEDPEPGDWVDVGQGSTDGRDDAPRVHRLRPGRSHVVAGRAITVDRDTGRATRVVGARLTLQRAVGRGWRSLATRSTDDRGQVWFRRTFHGSVSYRVVWRGDAVAVSRPIRFVPVR